MLEISDRGSVHLELDFYMEMECPTLFPHTHMDRRARKRPRLAWDVPPPASKAQPGIPFGQEVGNVASIAPSRAPPDQTCSSIYARGVARNGSPPRRDDDKDGHYMFALGDNLTTRCNYSWLTDMGSFVEYGANILIHSYDVLFLILADRIHSKMGEGTFGQVLECWDRERKEMVAIKVVRGIKKYREAAMIEIDVLQLLAKHDRNGIMHELHLIHTDLKPENILLTSSEYVKVPDYKVSSRSPKDGSYFKRLPKSSAIKVIDFGSTTYDHKDHSYIVSTRHYRAPEGEALFQTHENLEHLAMMEKVLGPLPEHILKRAEWVPSSAVDVLNLVMLHVDHSAGDLIDLLQGLLRYDPIDRLTAREALTHPFFTRDAHHRKLY
ncbi:Serine/threonine-protein kinase afc2 [Asimina triloba]